MKALDFLRCAIVSLLFSFVAPALTMEMSGPKETERFGERIVDVSALSDEQFDNLSEEEFQQTLADAPRKEPESEVAELFSFISSPWFLHFYIQAVLSFLPFIFLAAVCASFWNRQSAKPLSNVG